MAASNLRYRYLHIAVKGAVLSRFPGHLDGVLNVIPIGDAAWEKKDESGSSDLNQFCGGRGWGYRLAVCLHTL